MAVRPLEDFLFSYSASVHARSVFRIMSCMAFPGSCGSKKSLTTWAWKRSTTESGMSISVRSSSVVSLSATGGSRMLMVDYNDDNKCYPCLPTFLLPMSPAARSSELRGVSTAAVGYLPAESSPLRTTVQDRESSHPSTWPPVWGQNIPEGMRSYRQRHAGTRRTLGGKCGRWA